MKFSFFGLIVICTIFLSASFSYSQQDSTKIYIINKDTVEVGNYYTFYLSNKEAILARVVAVDSKKNNLLVYSESNLKTINIIDIVDIDNARNILYELSVRPKKTGQDRVLWFFGGGYSITKNGASSYRTYDNGFNLHTNTLVSFDNNFGMRADLDYDHFTRQDYIEYVSYTPDPYSYTVSGGSVNSLLLRINFAIGYLNPEEPFNFYIVPGLGIGGYYRTSEISTYNYSNRTSNVFKTGASDLMFTIGLSGSVGLSIKLTNKLRIYSEYQVNMWSGEVPNHNMIKAGLIYVGR